MWQPALQQPGTPGQCCLTTSSAASVSYAYGYQGWERGGGIHCKIGTGIYALQYIEQTANKDPLYRAGSPSQCSVMAYKTWAPSLGREDALEKEMASVFLPGKSHEQRSLEGYRSWGRKEPDVTEHVTKWLMWGKNLRKCRCMSVYN